MKLGGLNQASSAGFHWSQIDFSKVLFIHDSGRFFMDPMTPKSNFKLSYGDARAGVPRNQKCK